MSDHHKKKSEPFEFLDPIRPSVVKGKPWMALRPPVHLTDSGEMIPLKNPEKIRFRVMNRDGYPLSSVPMRLMVLKDGEKLAEKTLKTGPTGYLSTDFPVDLEQDAGVKLKVVPDIKDITGDMVYEVDLPDLNDIGTIQFDGLESWLPKLPDLDLNLFPEPPDVDDVLQAPELFQPSVIEKDGNCSLDFKAIVESRQFYFNQIVRKGEPRSKSQSYISNPISFDFETTNNNGTPVRTPTLGKLNLYKQSWTRVGHGIGKLLYSLALAPREETKIAVIEWARQQYGRRREANRAHEQLDHQFLRDRIIEEIVEGTVDEIQQGNSSHVEGGGGLTGSISGIFKGIMGAVGLSIGGSAASSDSFSEGHRTVTASTIQNLADQIVQRSTRLRSLYSMVVTQSAEAEQENITTRIVRNRNLNHALTVEYFQVLEHYAVKTELHDQLDVLLIPYEVPDALWDELPPFTKFLLPTRRRVIRRRVNGFWPWSSPRYEEVVVEEPVELEGNHPLLEQSELVEWLDQYGETLKPFLPYEHQDGIDALYRLVRTPEIYETDTPVVTVSRWTIELREGWRPGLSIVVHTKDGQTVTLKHADHQEGSAINTFTSSPVNVTSIEKIEVIYAPEKAKKSILSRVSSQFGIVGDTVLGLLPDSMENVVREELNVMNTYDLTRLRVVAHTDPSRYLLHTKSYELLDITRNGQDDLTADNPSTSFTAKTPEIDLLLTRSLRYKDYQKVESMVNHIKAHRMAYLRTLWLTEDPDRRALRFEQYVYPYENEYGDTQPVPLMNLIENRPVGIIGNQIAFPLNDQYQKDTLSQDHGLFKTVAHKNEKLISIPTRGVYAETLLSKCNATEMRDINRVIDVGEGDDIHAPDISGITPGSRHAAMDLQPSGVPGSSINIQNAPAAPDPTGMSGTLGLLASGDIFRDMSLGSETVSAASALARQALSESGEAQRAALEALEQLLTNAEQKQTDKNSRQALSAARDQVRLARQKAQQSANQAYRQNDPVRIRDHAQAIDDSNMSDADKSLARKRLHNAEQYPDGTQSTKEAEERERQRQLEESAPHYFSRQVGDNAYEYIFINFAVDKAELKDGHLEGLRELTQLMTMNDALGIYQASGYTSKTGSRSHNEDLAWDRTQSILTYLRDAGIASARIDGNEFISYTIEAVGEARSLADYLRENGYPVPDQLPAENPYDRGVVLYLTEFPELRNVESSEPYWKQPTDTWKIRFKFPTEDSGPDLAVPSPTDLESFFKLLQYGEVEYEAKGIYQVDGEQKEGPTMKGVLRGQLIKVDLLAASAANIDFPDDWITLNLDGAPLATRKEDWESVKVEFYGGQLERAVDAIVGVSPALRYLGGDDLRDWIRETIGIPEGLQFKLRILRHMTAPTDWFTWEETEPAIFWALHLQLPQFVRDYIAELPMAVFSVREIVQDQP
ncbi:MAG: OmpA family protein [Bacillaceae bacterium]|nr:OmpA family protein [Bacillaceae bacterium]